MSDRALCSRRVFLSTGAMAVAGLTLGMRPWGAARTLLPDPLDPALLRQLAMRAIEAAKAAGATYADVRVGEVQVFKLGEVFPPLTFQVNMDASCGYGVRALVDGVWGFVHGTVPTVDAVAAAARGAVTQARNAARGAAVRVELVPAAAATGEWRTPIEIDPFAVPLHEQMELLRSWTDTSSRVWGASGANPWFNWRRETRIFASTDGAMVTQTLHRAGHGQQVGSWQLLGGGPTLLSVPTLFETSGGYETVQDPSIDDRIKALAEEVRRYSSLPARTLDVGRYPAVFDGMTMAAVVGQTLGPALEIDRVSGEESDASGTSYLTVSQLGASVVSPLLTISADRAVPGATGVKWDDEGVEPASGPVIEAGRVVDYQTTRANAALLAPWYQQRNRPVRSWGCAVAPEADDQVQVRTGHLTVKPSASTATLEELSRDMTHGIIVRQGSWVATDQQLSSGSLNSYAALMLEVERGRIVRRVKSAGLQWNTLSLLRGITALGDRSTICDETNSAYKGQPWRRATWHTTAPAALLREVNVIDIGRPV
jgi:TldD protein